MSDQVPGFIQTNCFPLNTFRTCMLFSPYPLNTSLDVKSSTALHCVTLSPARQGFLILNTTFHIIKWWWVIQRFNIWPSCKQGEYKVLPVIFRHACNIWPPFKKLLKGGQNWFLILLNTLCSLLTDVEKLHSSVAQYHPLYLYSLSVKALYSWSAKFDLWRWKNRGAVWV